MVSEDSTSRVMVLPVRVLTKLLVEIGNQSGVLLLVFDASDFFSSILPVMCHSRCLSRDSLELIGAFK